MSWKNERRIHVRGEEWAWVITGDLGVCLRDPQGGVHVFCYEDVTGEALDPDMLGLPGDVSGIKGVTPSAVKEAVIKHLLPDPEPPHEKYDIIGDIHGCFGELMNLMDRLGHRWIGSRGIHKPTAERKIVFVGDIVDRGPRSVTALMYARYMVEAGYAVWVEGNHDNKLKRWAAGNNVTLNHGLAKTVYEFEREGLSRVKLHEFLRTLPHYAVLDHSRLVVAHGGWYEGLEHAKSGKRRSWCLYGPTTGRTLENGLPDRIDWAAQRKVGAASPMIVYGHQPYEEVRLINKTAGIDTGCCFGGKLTALRWPEQELVQVLAADVWDKEGRELNGFGG